MIRWTTIIALLGAAAAPAAAQRSIDRRIALEADASIRVFNLVGSIRITGCEPTLRWRSLPPCWMVAPRYAFRSMASPPIGATRACLEWSRG